MYADDVVVDRVVAWLAVENRATDVMFVERAGISRQGLFRNMEQESVRGSSRPLERWAGRDSIDELPPLVVCELGQR